MKKLFLSIFFVFLALLASTGVALAASSIPFNPQLVGKVAIESEGNSENVQEWTLTASGSQAPLGDFNYKSELVVHMDDGKPEFASGHGVFTGTGSAKGDSIIFKFKLTFSSPTASSPNVYPFTGTFTVTGGTGRFEDASGGGTINPGGANPTAHTFFGDWSGRFKPTG